ncbi:MAG: TIGR02757 family protein [Bacteroidota bacterium]
MSSAELKSFLDAKYAAFNNRDFIADDPISIPHRYTRKEDIEVAGLLSAVIAWGRRDLIVRAANQLMDLMWDAPFDFVMQAGEAELEATGEFVYRTFQGVDCAGAIRGLRRIYAELGGLERVMAIGPEEDSTFKAIVQLRQAMLDTPGFAPRTQKHFANPAKGSSAKRLNMYLRWMVRKDGRGVDFGLWQGVRPHQLICPLDVHTGNVGRKLGLISRKANDWKSALELTQALRRFDPEDPVKYDFSLFGLGVFEKF